MPSAIKPTREMATSSDVLWAQPAAPAPPPRRGVRALQLALFLTMIVLGLGVAYTISRHLP
jgi:hypothetical protein